MPNRVRRPGNPDDLPPETQALHRVYERLGEDPPVLGTTGHTPPPPGQPERRQAYQRDEDRLKELAGSQAAAFVGVSVARHLDKWLKKWGSVLAGLGVVTAGLATCAIRVNGPQAQIDATNQSVSMLAARLERLDHHTDSGFAMMRAAVEASTRASDSAARASAVNATLNCIALDRDPELRAPKECDAYLRPRATQQRATTAPPWGAPAVRNP